MRKMAFLGLCLMLGLAAVGCGDKSVPEAGDAQPVLKYTAIPDQNTTELAKRYAPLTLHLSKALGVPVEYVPSRDYQASVEMFRSQDILLAWFGGLTGVQARVAVPGAQAIAQGEVDPQYYSYFIANAGTGLERGDDFPADLGQYTFTFGSESSTSGRLMPEFFLKQNTGQSPMDFFAKPVGYSGSHDLTCELVEAGRFQTGVVNYKVYDRRVAEGKTNPEVCRIIWKTPFYADYNFTAHPALDEIYGAGFTRKLQDVLTAIDDPTLLSALPRNRLIPAANEEFAGIEAVARELGLVR